MANPGNRTGGRGGFEGVDSNPACTGALLVAFWGVTSYSCHRGYKPAFVGEGRCGIVGIGKCVGGCGWWCLDEEAKSGSSGWERRCTVGEGVKV